MHSLEILEEHSEGGLHLLIDRPLFSPNVFSEGHQEGLDFGLAHREVAVGRPGLRVAADCDSFWERVGVLVSATVLRVLVELLVDEVLVALSGRRVVGGLGYALVLG